MSNFGGGPVTREAFITALVALIFSVAYVTWLSSPANAIELQKQTLPSGSTPVQQNLSDQQKQITTLLPDLVVSSISNPPGGGYAGMSFGVTDTTSNIGYSSTADPSIPTSGTSETTYFLGSKSIGVRKVEALGAGMSSTGKVTVVIPSTTPAGSYYLKACADNTYALMGTVTQWIRESNEQNNCRLSATKITIGKPDLIVVSVSNPPAMIFPGSSFSVTDITRNNGQSLAQLTSITRYYLSRDLSVGGDLPIGYRVVSAGLEAGISSTGTTSVLVPATIPSGSYYLLACADDANMVSEIYENNNCTIAGGQQVLVGFPDLLVTSISDPPNRIKRGEGFQVTDTTANSGLMPTLPTITRYYLSVDQAKDGADVTLGSREVPLLAAGASGSATVEINVPTAVSRGKYWLIVCADDTDTVRESDETNNCKVSTRQITVQ